jgi:hypothetical protein
MTCGLIIPACAGKTVKYMVRSCHCERSEIISALVHGRYESRDCFVANAPRNDKLWRKHSVTRGVKTWGHRIVKCGAGFPACHDRHSRTGRLESLPHKDSPCPERLNAYVVACHCERSAAISILCRGTDRASHSVTERLRRGG